MNASRLLLPFDDWPIQDRAAWEALYAEGSLFDAGPCRHWTPGGRAKRRQGYARWLGFVLAREPGLAGVEPAERISLERVSAFIETESARCKPITVITRLDDLLALARRMAPETDWSWLYRAWLRLSRRHGPAPLKPRPPIDADTILTWALRRMAEVERDRRITPLQRAIRYREALMIGLLIARPVRARAFIYMEIGRHLVETDEGYRMEFTAGDMKDRRPHAYDLPRRLIEPMRHYLASHRLVLLKDQSHDALWVTKYGAPMERQGWTRQLPKITARHLGVALRPHAFRHIAATSIAERDPAHVGIIREVLGHATTAMGEKHYNRARGIDSCNKLQSIVADIRREARSIENRRMQQRSRMRRGPNEGDDPCAR